MGFSVCTHVFSLTVDTKRGYVGALGTARVLERRCPRTACLRRGPNIIYSYYTWCGLIRDRGWYYNYIIAIIVTVPPLIIIIHYQVHMNHILLVAILVLIILYCATISHILYTKIAVIA